MYEKKAKNLEAVGSATQNKVSSKLDNPPVLEEKKSSRLSFYDYRRHQNDYQEGKKIKPDDSSHEIYLVNKKPPITDERNSHPKYSGFWWSKTADSDLDALKETIAREFRRLINPAHPKSRYIKKIDGSYVVLSKDVPAFQTLRQLEIDSPGQFKENLINRKFRGLGELAILTLFLEELDLKPSNVGVDQDGNIITIDGGMSLGSLRNTKRSINYTKKELDHLPFIVDLNPYNYLDIVVCGITTRPKSVSVYFDDSYSKNEFFLHNKFYTTLKLSILPADLLDTFVDSYFPDYISDDWEKFRQSIKKVFHFEQNKLKELMGEDIQYSKYILSDQAEQDVVEFKQLLKNFIIMGKKKLCDYCSDISTKIDDQFISEKKQALKNIEKFFIQSVIAGIYDRVFLHIDYGFNINIKDRGNNSPFKLAIQHGHWGIAKLIFEELSKETPRLTDATKPALSIVALQDQKTHQVSVAHWNDKTFIRAMIEEIGGIAQLFFILVEAGDIAALQKLKDHNTSIPFLAKNADGRTALMTAVHQKNLTMIEFLLAQNTDIVKAQLQASTVTGDTAFLMAVRQGSQNIVEYLLINGINLESVDKTVLAVTALESDNFILINYLITVAKLPIEIPHLRLPPAKSIERYDILIENLTLLMPDFNWKRRITADQPHYEISRLSYAQQQYIHAHLTRAFALTKTCVECDRSPKGFKITLTNLSLTTLRHAVPALCKDPLSLIKPGEQTPLYKTMFEYTSLEQLKRSMRAREIAEKDIKNYVTGQWAYLKELVAGNAELPKDGVIYKLVTAIRLADIDTGNYWLTLWYKNKDAIEFVKRFQRSDWLNHVVNGGNLEIVKFLLGEGWDPEFDRLEEIAEDVPEGIIKLLILAGANLNKIYTPDINEYPPTCLLNLMIQEGHLEMVKYLLASGARPDNRVVGMASAFQAAVDGEYFEIVKYFLEHYTMEVDQTNVEGYTALELALDEDSFKIAQYLIRCGANIYHPRKNGDTILHYLAAKINNPEARQTLALAIICNNTHCFDIPNKAGKTPRDIAIEVDPKSAEFFRSTIKPSPLSSTLSLPLAQRIVSHSGLEVVDDKKLSTFLTPLDTQSIDIIAVHLNVLLRGSAWERSITVDNCYEMTDLDQAQAEEAARELAAAFKETRTEAVSFQQAGRYGVRLLNVSASSIAVASPKLLKLCALLVQPISTPLPPDSLGQLIPSYLALLDFDTIDDYMRALRMLGVTHSKLGYCVDLQWRYLTKLALSSELLQEDQAVNEFVTDLRTSIRNKLRVKDLITAIESGNYWKALALFEINKGTLKLNGLNLLSCAVNACNIDLVRYFIMQNFGDDITDPAFTHLDMAASKGEFEIVKLLIASGSLPGINSAKNFAIAINDIEFFKYLIAPGIPILDRGETGLLPEAVSKNKIEVIKLLMARGDNAYRRDNQGRTLLHLAVLAGSLEVLQYLLTHTEIDQSCVSDKEGNTPLHIAASSGRADLVECLTTASGIRLQYMLSVTNKMSKTPDEVATGKINIYLISLRTENTDAKLDQRMPLSALTRDNGTNSNVPDLNIPHKPPLDSKKIPYDAKGNKLNLAVEGSIPVTMDMMIEYLKKIFSSNAPTLDPEGEFSQLKSFAEFHEWLKNKWSPEKGLKLRNVLLSDIEDHEINKHIGTDVYHFLVSEIPHFLGLNASMLTAHQTRNTNNGDSKSPQKNFYGRMFSLPEITKPTSAPLSTTDTLPILDQLKLELLSVFTLLHQEDEARAKIMELESLKDLQRYFQPYNKTLVEQLSILLDQPTGIDRTAVGQALSNLEKLKTNLLSLVENENDLDGKKNPRL